MQSDAFKENSNQLMDYSTSMVFTIDLEGKIFYANPAFSQALGYTKNEACNIPLWDVLEKDGKETWVKFLNIVREGKEMSIAEATYFTKDGNPLIMAGMAQLLKDEKDNVFAVMVFPELTAVVDAPVELNVKDLTPVESISPRPMMSGSLFTLLDNQNSPMNRFLDSINDLVFFKDIKGIYRGCNQAFANLLNLPKEKIIGCNDYELYPPKIAKAFMATDEKIKQDSIPRKNEEWVIRANGHKTFVETLKTLYLDDHGEVMGFLGVSRDFTERKNAERELAENELWLDLYFNQSLSGKFFMMLSKPIELSKKAPFSLEFVRKIMDDVKIKRINPSMLNLYGSEEDNILGKSLHELAFYHTIEVINEFKVLLEEGHHHLLTSAKKSCDEDIWIYGDYTCLFDENGLLFGFYGNQRDVTKEIKIDEEVKAREKYLRTIIETTRDGYYAVDFDFNFIDVNNAYCEMSGYTREEILNMTLIDVLSAEQREGFSKDTQEIVKTGSAQLESEHLRKDGTTFDVEVSISKVGPPNNFFITFVRDITERKQLESFYLIEKELFKNTLLSAADGVISTAADGKVLILNSVAEKLTGWSQDQARGKLLNQIVTIMDKNENEVKDLVFQAIDTGKTALLNDDHQMLNHRGEQFFIELNAAPIVGEDQSYKGVVITLKDTTSRRKILKNFEDLSYKDALTNLYNRRYLDESLKKFGKDGDLPITIMVVDVNSLKLTNDAFGHALGDKLLKSVAAICQEVTRQEDIVCRSGGDEFVIILPNTDHLQAKAVKERIIAKVNQTYVSSVSISLAIGFATMKTKKENLDKVYATADHNMHQNKLKYGKEMKRKTVEKLLRKLKHKYPGLLIHNKDVSLYTYEFAKALNMSGAKCNDMKDAGMVHDIGKVMISSQVLKKAEMIADDRDSDIVKKHVEVGYQLLKEVDDFAHLAETVLHHHEWFDGSGFPAGISGSDIPLESRMLSITNVYEKMTGKRSFKGSLSKDEAIVELRLRKGTQLDPKLVDTFIEKVLLVDDLNAKADS